MNNNRVGQSRLIRNDGSEYIGQFIDDDADGHGIYTDKAGNRYMSVVNEDDIHRNRNDDLEEDEKSSGHFYKLRLFGKGKCNFIKFYLGEIKFKNGNTYIGQFKGGKRNGEGEMSYVNPPEKRPHDIGEYKGSWKRDKREGIGKMEYTNGSHFEGIWRKDEKYKGKLNTGAGEIYEGTFRNDQYFGKGKLIFSNGEIIEGTFDNGELKGDAKLIRSTQNGKGNY